MHFTVRGSFSRRNLIFWLGVNALVVACVAYQVATINRPPPPYVPPEVLANIKAAHARSPQVGQLAPEFSLTTAEGSGRVSLASLHEKKPVVLVFGSYTCSIFRGNTPAINEAFRRYKDQAEFVMIYVREAHPAETGAIPENKALGPIPAPTNLHERSQLAQTCATNLHLQMPLLVDDMDDSTAERYQSWPERLYVVGSDGRIAYAGFGSVQLNMPAMCEKLETLIERGSEIERGAE